MKLKNRKADKIWAEHEGYIRRLCSHKLEGRAQDADDCVQDVFLALTKALSEKKDIDNPKAWLTSVAYRRIADIYRESERNDVIFTPLNAQKIDELYSLTIPVTPDGDEKDESEIRYLKEVVINKLDENDRRLLNDRYVLEKSTSEIAEEYGLTENNVYQRLYRLRIKVKMLVKNVLNE